MSDGNKSTPPKLEKAIMRHVADEEEMLKALEDGI